MVKSFRRYLARIFLPYIGFVMIYVLYFLNKKEFIYDEIPADQPIIVAFWHEHLLMILFLWKVLRAQKSGAKVHAMISDHRDGEYIARTVKLLGIDSVRGSSSKGGAKALLNAIKILRADQDIAFTPDGPRGPRHSIADGIVVAAQKSGAKIVALSYTATKFRRLKSWDKFLIPLPFGKIVFTASKPFDISDMELEVAKKLIKEKLGTPEA